jgi:hypothetical protein
LSPLVPLSARGPLAAGNRLGFEGVEDVEGPIWFGPASKVWTLEIVDIGVDEGSIWRATANWC